MATPPNPGDPAALRARIEELESRIAVLDEIIAHSPGHFHVFDAEGRLVYASLSGLRILRRYGMDVLGRNWRDLSFPPELMSFCEAELREVAMSGSAVRRKIRLPTDAGPRDFEYRLLPIRDDAGRITHVLLVARDMTETRAAQAAVHQRLRIERLLATLCQQFLSVAAEDVDLEISRALERIGDFDNVDRAYLFEMSPDGTTTTNTHEWCRDGVSPQIGNLKNLEVDDFKWFFDQLADGRVVHIPVVADIPDEAADFRALLVSQDIRSLVCIPVMRSGRLIAFLGFDAVRGERTWSVDDTHLLRAAGEILVHARERKRAEEALRQSPLFLRAIAESIPGCLAYIDSAEQIRFANEGFRRAVGATESNLHGCSLRTVLGEHDYQGWRHALRRVMAGEEVTTSLPGFAERADGGPSITLVPHREGDAIAGFVAYAG